jgi:integrase
VRCELGVLRAAIRYCYREGKLTHEVPIALPDKTPAKQDWFTRQEVAMLLRAAKNQEKARGHLPLFILLGIYTGHRMRAILGLQWQPNTVAGHVDLERGIIDFQGRRKPTKKARARIPLTRRLTTFLRLARKRTQRFPIEHEGHGLDSVKRSFRTACLEAAKVAEKRATGADHQLSREAWLATAEKFRRGSPHVLRHTATTWLVTKGLPLADVGEWVGMSEEMVSRVYGHLAPERMLRVRSAIDAR